MVGSTAFYTIAWAAIPVHSTQPWTVQVCRHLSCVSFSVLVLFNQPCFAQWHIVHGSVYSLRNQYIGVLCKCWVRVSRVGFVPTCTVELPLWIDLFLLLCQKQLASVVISHIGHCDVQLCRGDSHTVHSCYLSCTWLASKHAWVHGLHVLHLCIHTERNTYKHELLQPN